MEGKFYLDQSHFFKLVWTLRLPRWKLPPRYAFFTILVPPGSLTLTGYATGTHLSLGDALTLTCQTCNGNPPPLVIWTETGRNIELASSFTVDGNGCTAIGINLGPMTVDDHEKTYECFAANGVDPEKRASRTLSVACKTFLH